ncbi:hypothetical protein HK101_001694 [Irineochytrium annulatum]|nr:hypothetical protein HK101_001694 [Irineochytrium annulatum]
MNGDWMPYHKDGPDAFIASWIKMAKAVRAVNTNNVALVWSPNMDRNDAFAAWYPGDQYVDWVGLSIYYKGPLNTYPWHVNTLCPENYFSEIINGADGYNPSVDFYQTYAAAKNKPFVLSEGAAAYQISYSQNPDALGTPAEGTSSQADGQNSFWTTSIFNSAFLASHPLFRMVNMFEFKKIETENPLFILRDFRTTVDNATLAQFVSNINANPGAFAWASKAVTSTTTTTTSATMTTATAAVTISSSAPSSAPSSTASVKSGASREWGVGAVVSTMVAVMVAALAVWI